MAGLVPFNSRSSNLTRAGAGPGFEDFYNMLDDFFGDNLLSNRNLLRDTFKIDIKETDSEYLVEAELPGVKKEEIDLNIEDDALSIAINRTEETDNEGKNYIHRERRSSSMGRRIRLANARLGEIRAKLEEGVLIVTIPKEEKAASPRKIDIE
ncbi:MAG: Hsp20/alpha crystallin family protein [Coriobacteriales bacterium]|jgi:HSP20 family protein|nr:Hsp20/alpha crystallin family protein [Coriobacteriales bacterium]